MAQWKDSHSPQFNLKLKAAKNDYNIIFENAVLFLRLGLLSTLTRHENKAFQERSSIQRNLKTPAFRLRVDRKPFENGPF